MRIGAWCKNDASTMFRVWAPQADSVAAEIVSPRQKTVELSRDDHGYWSGATSDCPPDSRYWFSVDGRPPRPDPASHFQPEGVHKPSAIVDHAAFAWQDHSWGGIPLEEAVIYELHVGTFTPEGTFHAVAGKLDYLKDLGVNTLQLMPVAAFPGSRNWGYDGVYPWAVQESYGGPLGLKRLIDAAHRNGMAVLLDVVYNHLGPEGNYLHEFGPYFTEKYKTPWGWAVNYDGPYSDEVRNYFIENALFWLRQYHADGLRLDAIHGIFDISAHPFLMQLAEAFDDFSSQSQWPRSLIAESDLNDSRYVRSRQFGGFGMHSQWSDDFHHSLHTLLTGENNGYYRDFGKLDDLVSALRDGYVYNGRYSEFRKRHHGNDASDLPGRQFIISTQTHDQVGNRMMGDRLSTLVSFEPLKLAAGMLLTAPALPMLFMGEEYAETRPFLYFVSHGDKDLVEAVRNGRKEEFESFDWNLEPPDPQSEETFDKSRLDWSSHEHDDSRVMLAFYKALLRHRREIDALTVFDRSNLLVSGDEERRILTMHRWSGDSEVWIVASFAETPQEFEVSPPQGKWRKLLDSADREWRGPGTTMPDLLTEKQHGTIPGHSIVMYDRMLHE